MENQYICEICGKIFNSSKGLSNHSRSHNPIIKSYECDICGKICSRAPALVHHKKSHFPKENMCCHIITKEEMTVDRFYRYDKRIIKCKQCGDEFHPGNGIEFCSLSCSATYTNAQKPKSEKMLARRFKMCPVCKIMWEDPTYGTKKCCSDLCLKQSKLDKLEKMKNNRSSYSGYSGLTLAQRQENGRKGGLKSASQKIKRSKDEIKLYEIIKQYYPNIKHNEPIIDGWDADIIFDDIKLAILWNGPWHYKEMGHSNHSLKQVQTRDKIKTDLFTKNGWKVLIFEDRYHTPETAAYDIIKCIDGR